MPSQIIEKKEILNKNPNVKYIFGIPVVSDEVFIKTLTSNDLVLIGSYSFSDQIADRLKQLACKAKIINANCHYGK